MDIDLRVGDSLEGLRSLPDGCIDLVFTSPPYADLRAYKRIKPDDYVEWFLPWGYEIKRVLKPTGSFVVNIREKIVDGEEHPYVDDLKLALRRQVGFGLNRTYIWHKTKFLPEGGQDRRNSNAYEYVFWWSVGRHHFDISAVLKEYTDDNHKSGRPLLRQDPTRWGVRDRSDFYRRGGADPGNVLSFPNTSSQRFVGHEAPMPEALADFFLRCGSPPNGLVCDPFLGSGTTAVVAAKLGRRFIGWDIHPEYVEIAQKRLQSVQTVLGVSL